MRITPSLVLPAVLGAAALAFVIIDRGSPTASAAAPSEPPLAVAAQAPGSPVATNGALPPNHPAIAAGPRGPGSPPGHGHGGHGGASSLTNGDNEAPPALAWTVPAGWQTLANPNAMRLATYGVGDSAQASVARAGGDLDANIQRWESQFDGSPKAERSHKQVHGLEVTVVRIAGTFLGSGMSGAGPEKHEGWAMLAAVVASNGAPYFFKVVGAADQVDHARPAFDALVDSVAPKAP